MPLRKKTRSNTARALRGATALSAIGGAVWLMGACGARTGLHIPPPAPECFTDADCPGIEDLCKPVYCQLFSPTEGDAGTDPTGTGGGTGGGDDSDGGAGGAGGAGGETDAGPPRPKGGVCKPKKPVECDDNDACTNEECDSWTGQCVYSPTTFDLDGDGYRAPRPGKHHSDPDACGDDCNDASAAAHPSATEICDGVDNNCNDIIDENADYIPLGLDAVRISGDIAPSGPGGVAWSGSSYATIYTGASDGFDIFRNMLDVNGAPLTPGETLLTLVNADASGGPIVWVGDRYGLAWQDRRNGDYEVYFTILDENGEKVHADTRITEAFGFSINVALTWNGTEFIAVWQDEREGLFNLYGQRINVDSEPVGGNVPLTDPQGAFGNEGPSIASGTLGVGVAWTVGDAFTHLIQFQTFTPELDALSVPVSLTDGSTDAVYPTIVWNKDRYIVAWFDKSASPKGIYAAAVAEDGTVLVPARPITDPGPFRSRYPYLRPLGDRVLVLYADDRDQNDGYELYSRMIDAETLDPLAQSPNERRLTQAKLDSIYPTATFGPNGDVGILFRDHRDGEQHVYFMNLGCVSNPSP